MVVSFKARKNVYIRHIFSLQNTAFINYSGVIYSIDLFSQMFENRF
jgi:hypothetical protein